MALHPTITSNTNDPDDVTAEYHLDGYRVSDRPPGDLTVTVDERNDGGDDVPTWGTNPIVVQLDTNAEARATGIIIRLNDGPPIYQGDPEFNESAAEVLRKVRVTLTDPTMAGDHVRVAAALDAITRSGVIL